MVTTSTVLLPSINSLCRRTVVEQATGHKRSTLYRKIKHGLFPKPVTIATDKHGEPCQVAWPFNEVQAVINARIAGKSDEDIKALVATLEAARGAK